MITTKAVTIRKIESKRWQIFQRLGAIVTTAILLSGLSLIGSNQQPVLAQEQQATTTTTAKYDKRRRSRECN
jgi:hypothetical protein